MAAISLRNIVKKYGDGFPAVNDVSIEIADGEFVILVGPSGCGKSTLLRMIVGLEDITSGDMVIGDRKVNDLAPRERNLAMVFQNYALYPHLSVYENIAFPLRLAGASDEEVDEKVRNASKTLELDEHLERKPGNLSGGQRQRVAMGRAIVRDADAFLFDEPLSNLDAKLREEMQFELRRIQRSVGTTTIMVTHDQAEALSISDRVVVMEQGAMTQVDAPYKLYERPATAFISSFVGKMNRIEGVWQGGRAEVAGIALPSEQALLADGQAVALSLRPEKISLLDGDDAAENSVDGVIA
ncbi:MAG: ATP-binding cassette domain-containing protein, partial [Actinobacteria bacterium]|nr:ATP-binding cassette domain-containing protein [Actinomycetota bacterium]